MLSGFSWKAPKNLPIVCVDQVRWMNTLISEAAKRSFIGVKIEMYDITDPASCPEKNGCLG